MHAVLVCTACHLGWNAAWWLHSKLTMHGSKGWRLHGWLGGVCWRCCLLLLLWLWWQIALCMAVASAL